MRNLHDRCREWLQQLPAVSKPIQCYPSSITHISPQNFHTLQKQSAEHSDPLYRLFFREGSIGSRLLSQDCKDLTDVVQVCEGGLKQTNHLRTLMSSLTKGKPAFHFTFYTSSLLT